MKNTSQPNKIKPTVFIVEGCDLSGKSTLTNALIKEFPGIMMKITARPQSKDRGQIITLKKYYHSVLDYINRFYQSKTIVLDRFFPSEMVYSKVKRGYEGFADEDYKDMEKVLNHRNHILIYCDPGKETIFERLKARGDDYINESDISALLDRYEKFFKYTTLKKLRLDTKKSVETLIEEIKIAL